MRPHLNNCRSSTDSQHEHRQATTTLSTAAAPPEYQHSALQPHADSTRTLRPAPACACMGLRSGVERFCPIWHNCIITVRCTCSVCGRRSPTGPHDDPAEVSRACMHVPAATSQQSGGAHRSTSTAVSRSSVRCQCSRVVQTRVFWVTMRQAGTSGAPPGAASVPPGKLMPRCLLRWEPRVMAPLALPQILDGMLRDACVLYEHGVPVRGAHNRAAMFAVCCLVSRKSADVATPCGCGCSAGLCRAPERVGL